jgi:formylglycine-generating enzyme required for sulfatase activity
MRKEIGVPENFVYIPSNRLIDSKLKNFDEFFWMMNTEVSNEMYNSFLNALRSNGMIQELQTIQIQRQTRYGNNLNSRFLIYDTSSLYQQYPVLNISYESAQLYCQWLNKTLKDTTWEYRLPTKEEWTHAAQGEGYFSYSWSSPFFSSNKGYPMCKYLHIGDESIHLNESGIFEILIDSSLLYHSAFPVPVFCYEPNDWGLYNMCGNVAEMVIERGTAVGGSFLDPGFDVQIYSTQNYKESSPKVGFRPILVKKK